MAMSTWQSVLKSRIIALKSIISSLGAEIAGGKIRTSAKILKKRKMMNASSFH